MKERMRRLSALAMAGVIGMSMAGLPVNADGTPEGSEGKVTVTYTSGAVPGTADGKLLMVLPANVYLSQNVRKQDGDVTIRMADANLNLPEDLKYTIEVDSTNDGVLKSDQTNKTAKYTADFSYKKSAVAKDADYKNFDLTKTTNDAGTASEYKELLSNDFTQVGTDNNIGPEKDTPTGNESAKGTYIKHAFKTSITEAEAKKLEGVNGVDYTDVLSFKLSNVESTSMNWTVKPDAP